MRGALQSEAEKFPRWEIVGIERFRVALDPLYLGSPGPTSRQRRVGIVEAVVNVDGTIREDVRALDTLWEELSVRHTAWSKWNRGADVTAVALGIGLTASGGVVALWGLAGGVLSDGFVCGSLMCIGGALVWIKARRIPAIWRAYRRRLCPDCGYDLSATPDAVPPGLIHGVRTGPRVCTECESPWPLIPSPASVEFGTELQRRINPIRVI